MDGVGYDDFPASCLDMGRMLSPPPFSLSPYSIRSDMMPRALYPHLKGACCMRGPVLPQERAADQLDQGAWNRRGAIESGDLRLWVV